MDRGELYGADTVAAEDPLTIQRRCPHTIHTNVDLGFLVNVVDFAALQDTITQRRAVDLSHIADERIITGGVLQEIGEVIFIIIVVFHTFI